MIHVAKDMPAGLCSTGEQKALLIAVMLAHARLHHAYRGRSPLLLLDEEGDDDEEKVPVYHIQQNCRRPRNGPVLFFAGGASLDTVFTFFTILLRVLTLTLILILILTPRQRLGDTLKMAPRSLCDSIPTINATPLGPLYGTPPLALPDAPDPPSPRSPDPPSRPTPY